MTAPTRINHRRDRQLTRRILAEIVVRGRDLTGSFFREDIDLMDQLRHSASNDNGVDVSPIEAARKRR